MSGSDVPSVQDASLQPDLNRHRPFAGTFVVDVDGRLRAITLLAHDRPSPEGARLRGRPLAAVVGFARSPEAQAALQAALTRAFAGESVRIDIELPAVDDAPWAVVEVRLRTARRGTGALVAVGSLTDVTARRWLERQLREASQMATVGRLARGMAQEVHDLLEFIGSRATALAAHVAPTAEAERLSANLSVACEQGSELLQQLAAYSREASLIGPPIALHLIVAENEEPMRQLLGANITLSSTLEASRDAVRIDRASLTQILISLAANAREAMPAGGHVSLRTSNLELAASEAPPAPGMPAGRYICLSFDDSGFGTTPSRHWPVAERIITTNRNRHSAGVGLALVQRIVEEHDGTIIVRSDQRGTSFRIYLGLVPDDDAAIASRLAGRAADRGPGQIVLVDLDPVTRFEAERTLRRSGYRVISVADGSDVVSLPAHWTAPDLLIVDLDTYGQSELDFVAFLRHLAPALRVMFTGVPRWRSSEPEPACDEVLWKPYSSAVLLERVRRIFIAQTLGTP